MWLRLEEKNLSTHKLENREGGRERECKVRSLCGVPLKVCVGIKWVSAYGVFGLWGFEDKLVFPFFSLSIKKERGYVVPFCWKENNFGWVLDVLGGCLVTITVTITIEGGREGGNIFSSLVLTFMGQSLSIFKKLIT